MRHITNTLNEHTSYDDINAEGRGRSRMLPIKLAFRLLKGKGNETKSFTINLKTQNDYNILWKQLMNAGSKISIPKIDKETGTRVEMGPRSFANALDILGIEDATDLQDFIEDPVYREMLETEEKIKFSFGRDKRKDLDTIKRRITTSKDLAAIGVSIDGEGESWEWGNGDDDMMKTAPEGRDIWVIRAHEYPEYPCIFVYPYEGNNITDYSTALDIFFMDICKADGIIYDYYDPKKFNLLWVACPCKYDWFKKNPTPTSAELEKAKKVADEIQANQAAIEDTDYDTYNNDFEYRLAESKKDINADRKKLQKIVESYGKEDVLNYVNHLNESSIEEVLSDSTIKMINELKEHNLIPGDATRQYLIRISSMIRRFADQCRTKQDLNNICKLLTRIAELTNSSYNEADRSLKHKNFLEKNSNLYFPPIQ